jgi:acetolactate synthase-1/2/3 large subunit
MIVSDYIFDFLQRKGVDTAFMVSGGQAMFLVDSLGRHKAIRTICTHHEQSAGMAADAYSRITGKLGVALVTAGPGSVNIVNGLVGGWTDSAPMMIISGQSALSCVNYQAKSGIRQYGIQGINIQPFVEKATKYFVTVDDPAKIQYYMEKAYYLAMNGRPGPVWIDVPLDVQRMEVPEKLLYPYHPETKTATPSCTHDKLLKTWELLKDSKRPLIVAGQGVRIAKADLDLRKLIETLKIPLITTRLGIDLIESEHPLYVGRPGNYGDRAANFAVQNADFILAIGSRLSTASVGHDSESFGKHAVKVMVDIDPKELDKPGVQLDLKINSDAKSFILSLLSIINAGQMQDTNSWISICNGWKRDYPVVLPEYKNEKPVNSYYFTERLCEKTGSEDVVLVDTGSCFHVACQTWTVKKGQHFLTTGGLSSMGYWVAGIGACAANRYRRTIVITGDGSLQMNIQELATIKHNNLPIKIIIFNNNGYLLIRQTQRNFMEGRLFGEGPESGVWCPDSLRIAEAYGIKGVRINSVDELDPKIDEVLAYDGPVVCDVMTPEWQLLIPRVSSEKLPSGKLVSRKYEDMFPYLPEAELKRNMVSEKTT